MKNLILQLGYICAGGLSTGFAIRQIFEYASTGSLVYLHIGGLAAFLVLLLTFMFVYNYYF